MDLILKLIKGETITDEDLEYELYEICDRVHACCNNQCPVYQLNGNKIPNTKNDFKVNRGCDCFKSGKDMLSFIRSKNNLHIPVVSPRLFYVVAQSYTEEGNWEQISNGFEDYSKAKQYRDGSFCKGRWPNAFIVASLNVA